MALTILSSAGNCLYYALPVQALLAGAFPETERLFFSNDQDCSPDNPIENGIRPGQRRLLAEKVTLLAQKAGIEHPIKIYSTNDLTLTITGGSGSLTPPIISVPVNLLTPNPDSRRAFTNQEVDFLLARKMYAIKENLFIPRLFSSLSIGGGLFILATAVSIVAAVGFLALLVTQPYLIPLGVALILGGAIALALIKKHATLAEDRFAIELLKKPIDEKRQGLSHEEAIKVGVSALEKLRDSKRDPTSLFQRIKLPFFPSVEERIKRIEKLVCK